MVHAYLAEHQSHALAHRGADGEQDAVEGEVEGEPVVVPVVASEHGDGDSGERDDHGEYARRGDSLAECEPCHDGGCDGGEGHEELAEARADDDVALEEAVVAYHVADQSGEHHPSVGVKSGAGG